jgi:hypothetical protein
MSSPEAVFTFNVKGSILSAVTFIVQYSKSGEPIDQVKQLREVLSPANTITTANT